MESSSEYFAKRVDDYSVSYLREDEAVLADRYFKKGGRVLVLGCGAGRVLTPLQERGLRVVGIDVVPEMIEEARKLVSGQNIEVKIGDATKLDFSDKSFDYVFFPFHGIDNIHPSIEIVLKEATRVLTNDGVFISNSHNRWFLKDLHRMFQKYAEYHGLRQYRSTPFDYFLFKKYFKKARVHQRISLKRDNFNWKDRLYRLFPFLNKSTYFVGMYPKR